MDIIEATAAYERWLAQHLTIVDEDLAEKHEQMAAGGPFPFFRATYYRWLQRLPDLLPTLDGPVVAAVGDLHLENFGTWQTSGGRLAWGVNDFDESECLPYEADIAYQCPRPAARAPESRTCKGFHVEATPRMQAA